MNNPYLLILIGEFFFTALAVCVKFVSSSLHVMEIVWIRSLVSISCLAFLMLYYKVSLIPANPKIMLIRALAGAGSMMCNFYSLSKLPLGESMVLFTTFPLFIVVLDFFILKEKPKFLLIILTLIGWAGVYIILAPQFDTFGPSAFITLLGSFLTALDLVLIHILSKSEEPLRVGIFFVIAAFLFATPFMLTQAIMPSPYDLSFLIAAGVMGTGAILTITKAYGLGKISKISPMAYSAVVMSYLSGLLLWNEKPSVYSIAGSVVVIITCIVIMRMEKSL
ncbi:DMT family transporter [bacterium]|nr:DMT family transporter [bacterium]